MEVAALCIRPIMSMLMLLAVKVHPGDSWKTVAAYPKVVPHRQQHFEYESVVVSCEGWEGRTRWRVMRNIKGVNKTCGSKTSAGSCEITNTFSVDSGEYWCEHGDQMRSNAVNITITTRPVILESPVRPVMEGDDVTLRCRKKTSSGDLTADFYRDGVHVGTSSTGELVMHRVSTSEEGLYKCHISGAGESPESWVTVRAFGDSRPCSPHGFLVLRIVGTVLLVALGLVMVLLHCRRERCFNLSTLRPCLRFATKRSQAADSPD